jgi:Holliday junction DNA helicase RuvB
LTDVSLSDDRVRPTEWDAYVGQERLKARLDIAINAAINQERRLDDILMIAPPGCGKTTLAALIADQYLADFKTIVCPMKPDRFFYELEEFDSGVVLLDELHSAPKAFQELLQPGLEEDRVILTPDGFTIDVSGITFIGATVPEFAPKVLAPLQSRFMLKPHWEDYTDEHLALILSGMATSLGFELDSAVCAGLASACHGTPRQAKRFVKAARDLEAVGRAVTVEAILDYVGVDADGLDPEHLDYMRVLYGQPMRRASLKAMATLLMMTTSAVENLERVLRLKGLIEVSPTGRRLSDSGKAKLGVRKERRSA